MIFCLPAAGSENCGGITYTFKNISLTKWLPGLKPEYRTFSRYTPFKYQSAERTVWWQSSRSRIRNFFYVRCICSEDIDRLTSSQSRILRPITASIQIFNFYIKSFWLLANIITNIPDFKRNCFTNYLWRIIKLIFLQEIIILTTGSSKPDFIILIPYGSVTLVIQILFYIIDTRGNLRYIYLPVTGRI